MPAEPLGDPAAADLAAPRAVGVPAAPARGLPRGGDARRRQDDLRAAGRGRAARRPDRRRGHRGHPDRAPEEPVGAAPPPRLGDPARPDLPQRRRRDRARLPRRGRDVRAGGRGAGAAPGAHGEPPHAGRAGRGAPRRRRAVLGRRGAGGVRAGGPAAGADRHAVPLGREPDPVRPVRAGAGRGAALGRRPRVRVRRGAAGRRGPAGDLPGVLGRGPVADPGRAGAVRPAGRARHGRARRAGLADRARPGRRLDAGGAAGGRPAAVPGPDRRCRTPAGW